MPEPTVDQVLKINLEKPVTKPSAVWPIVAFFIFPPLGITLLWREKSFHWIYAVLVAILSVSNLLSFGSICLFTFPKLTEMYTNLKISQPTYLTPLFICVIFLATIQTVLAIYLARKAKAEGYLEDKFLILITILIVLTYLILPVIIGFLVVGMILPIYNLTSTY